MIDLEKTEIWKKLVNKITELEKKFKVINDDNIRMFKDIQLSLEANFRRIEKLEKNVEHKRLIINTHWDEIKELKEQFELHKTSHPHPNLYKMIKGNWNLIKKQEGVLRELLEELRFCKEEKDNRTNAAWIFFYDTLLEKLGGEIEQYGRKDGNPSLSVKPTDTSKPPRCEFYKEDYCCPCDYSDDITKCDLFQIGTQIKIEKWNPLEQERYAVKDEITGVTNYLKKEKEPTSSARQTEMPEGFWERNHKETLKLTPLKNPSEQDTLCPKCNCSSSLHIITGSEEWICPEKEKEPTERKDCLFWTPIHKCNYFNERLNTGNLTCRICKAYKGERPPDATGIVVEKEALEWWARDTRGPIHDSIKKYLEET